DTPRLVGERTVDLTKATEECGKGGPNSQRKSRAERGGRLRGFGEGGLGRNGDHGGPRAPIRNGPRQSLRRSFPRKTASQSRSPGADLPDRACRARCPVPVDRLSGTTTPHGTEAPPADPDPASGLG